MSSVYHRPSGVDFTGNGEHTLTLVDNPGGGPQNSLTSWGDEGQGAEIRADYEVV